MDDEASDANTSYEAHTLSSLSVDGEAFCTDADTSYEALAHSSDCSNCDACRNSETHAHASHAVEL